VEELETEAGVSAALRERIAGLPVGEVRERLRGELERGSRQRWNAAARAAGADQGRLDAVFGRLERVGLAEADLEPLPGFNFRLWQLRQATGSEGDVDYWRERRDRFVEAARRSPEIAARPDVSGLLAALEALALRDEGHRGASLSPARVGWREELADGGQRVVATWSGAGRRVRIEYQLVEPAGGGAAYYLARHHLAVGDFLALIDGRAEGAAILEAMPRWVLREGDSGEPWSAPLAWRPRADRGGIELNSRWIYRPDAQLAPFLGADAESGAGAAVAPLVRERPSERSPLQRVSPDLARRLCEELLGARLPTPAEWRALAAAEGAAEAANRRDARFATLWRFLETARAGDQGIAWRPNRDIFLPLQAVKEGARTRRLPLADDGRAVTEAEDGHLFPADVDAGPESFGFVHLFGNVWTYLHDPDERRYYVAGGSALAPPGIDAREPQRVEGIPLIGNSRGQALTDGFSDVGVRPAFDAPPGVRDRLEMFRLVRTQQFLTL
jgi:formylglycine-generating enzyme required for sulfatase activity